jgi:hypothetical protein
MFLEKVLISVSCPGYGDISGATYYTLQAGACLLVHEHFNRIKLLPHVDLIDGEDYVSFNVDTFEKKLRELLDNPERTRLIGRSGQAKMGPGLDVNRSCRELFQKLKEL